MFLSSIFALAAIFYNVNGAKVSYCTGIQYTGVYASANDNTTLYSFSFDVDATFNPNNQTYPNHLIISNLTNWSLNSSLYYSVDFIWFWYFYQYYDACPSIFETCIINFPNSEIGFRFSLNLIDTTVPFDSFDGNFFYNGVFFDDKFGNILIDDGQKSCMGVPTYCTDPNNRVKCYLNACCISVAEVDISDNEDDPCQEFISETTVLDASSNIQINFSANYLIDNNAINIKITKFTSNFFANTGYEFGKTYENEYCNGYDYDPLSSCSWTLPSENYRFVSYLYAYTFNNYTYGPKYFVSIADINYENGIFLKNNSIPFTQKDPCFQSSAYLPLLDNTQTTTSFCCKRFKSGVTIATQNPEITTTPKISITTPSTTKYKCLKYRSSTTVSDNSTYLEVEYILNSTTLFVDITNYFAAKQIHIIMEIQSKHQQLNFAALILFKY